MKDSKMKMVPVPLPTEVPPPPSLENIPLEILHSATVEMLIQQNEDLSSRLKINIRRNSQLEQKIINQEKDILELNRKRENVLAQIDLIKEKEKIWSSNKQDKEKQIEALKKESELLEQRYYELHATHQQKNKAQQRELCQKQTQIVELENKLNILHKVRHRAKERLRTLLLEMAQSMQNNFESRQKSESTNRLLQKNFANLKEEISEKESLFTEQLSNLKQASQKGLMAFDEKVTQLTEQRKQLLQAKQDLEKELEEVKINLHNEKKNRIKLSQVSEELTELRNQQIRLKRQHQDQLDQQQQVLTQRLEQYNKLKNELNQIASEKDGLKQSLSASEKQTLQLRKDNQELSHQLSSLQSLWMETQARLEKEELRSQALEKINRQLSQQNQKEKVQRATDKAHDKATDKAQGSSKQSQSDSQFQEKIQSVFASQYKTMAKEPGLDI